MSRDWNYLAEVAIAAAGAAGELIREKMEEDIAVEYKEAGSSYASQVVTAVDKAAEAVILQHLKPTCENYDLAMLTEESEDDGQRFEKDYFWCVDPLDGTLAFIEKRPDFAVSIGLVSRSGEAKIGVVYDPSRDILYHAIAGEDAFKNGKPWQTGAAQNHLTYVSDHPLEKSVGRELIQRIIDQKTEELNVKEIKIVSGGGLVINAMRTAENHPAFMLKVPKEAEGGGSIWDYAASVCICQELGMSVSNFEGERLNLNPEGGTFMNRQGMVFSSF